jgi:hypothetical protein
MRFFSFSFSNGVKTGQVSQYRSGRQFARASSSEFPLVCSKECGFPRPGRIGQLPASSFMGLGGLRRSGPHGRVIRLQWHVPTEITSSTRAAGCLGAGRKLHHREARVVHPGSRLRRNTHPRRHKEGVRWWSRNPSKEFSPHKIL